MKYILSKEVLDELGNKTTVFFTGWELNKNNNRYEPQLGSPHLDGIRKATLYQTQDQVNEILDNLDADFRKDLIVMEVKLQLV